MSSFTEFTGIRPVPDSNLWTTLSPFRFYIDDSLEGEYVEVPAGTTSDGCSIPFCFIGAKVTPKTITACILHDYLWSNYKGIFTFGLMNLIFFRALRANKVCFLRALIYFIGVSTIGYFTYLKK